MLWSIWVPLPSGPRCARAVFISRSIHSAAGPGWVKPVMPHMSPPCRNDAQAPLDGWVLHYSLKLIGRLATCLEIDPRLHLGHDSEQHKESAGEAHRGCKQRQRRLDQRDIVP